MPYKIRDDYKEYLEDLQDEYIYNFGERRVKNDIGRELELLLREIEKATRPSYYRKSSKKKKKDGGGGSFSGNSGFKYSKKQLCIIKASYRNDIKKHKSFIKSYMPQHDKKEVKVKPNLFDDKKDIVSEEELKEYQKIIDKKFFRIILSPERQDISLKLLTRVFIKRIEELTGYELYWHGVEHHNTLKQHVHIEINGRDKKGQDVIFDKYFFTDLFREIAQDICTAVLGERTAAEIRQDIDKRIRVERWTRFDNEIKEKMRRNIDQDFPYSIEAQNSNMQSRLLFLDKYGYAKKIGAPGYPGKFLLHKDWEMKLRDSLLYNSFIKAQDQMKYNKNVNLKLYEHKNNSNEIKGKVIKIIDEDIEVTRQNAFILQDEKNQYWYVPRSSFLPKNYLNQNVVVQGQKVTRVGERSQKPSPVQKTTAASVQIQAQKPQVLPPASINKTSAITPKKKKGKKDQEKDHGFSR